MLSTGVVSQALEALPTQQVSFVKIDESLQRLLVAISVKSCVPSEAREGTLCEP